MKNLQPKKWESVITLAIEKGFTVERKNDNKAVLVCKKNKRSGLIIDGVTLYEDGTAIRAGVDLTVCTLIKTKKEVMETLKL